jgi:predicted dehydrogenase
MTERIRIGVIGASWYASFLLSVLAGCEDAKIAAICGCEDYS